jgi:DNA-binding transcriptional ArsR family regulator
VIDPSGAKALAALLAGMADPTRLLVLYRLAGGPKSVGELAEQVGVSMVNVSHHLGVMWGARLLDREKQGRQVIYSLLPGLFTPGGGPGELGTLALGAYRLTLLDRRAVKSAPKWRKKS